jgi:hypothetical protein
MGGYIPTWSETLSAQCDEHDGKGTNGVTAVTFEAVLRAHYLRDETRRWHQCIYISRSCLCYANPQDRRIKIIANSSPNLGSSWMACNRFRAFFLSSWSGVVDRTVPQALVHTEITNSQPIWQAKRRVGRTYGRAVVPRVSIMGCSW